MDARLSPRSPVLLPPPYQYKSGRAVVLFTAWLAVQLAACGPQVVGPPGVIDAEPLEWSWVPTNSSYCGEGSETGLGVNPAVQSDTLFIYLNGGGACWDHQSCVVDEAATYVTKGFGPQAFNVYRPDLELGPFDRDAIDNPLKNAHFAWIPYCTGDFHAGTRTIDYDGVTVRHVGYHNMGVFLERLRLTFPDVKRVILAGSSAGGYGAMLNWERTQRLFADVPVYVIDDAGPLLPAPYLSQQLHQLFNDSWNLAAILPEGCVGCQDDLSQLHAVLSARYPAARAALLGYSKDKIIAGYLGLNDADYADGAAALHAELDVLDNIHYFIDVAEGHALLPKGYTVSTSAGTVLDQWLTLMLTDDPSWGSLKP